MPTLDYNNFKYIVEDQTDFNNGMKIEFKSAIPENLYKYYSSQPHNLKSLIEGDLYFSHPYGFNDIIDTNLLSFDFSKINFDTFSRLFGGTGLNAKQLEKLYEDEKTNGFQFYRLTFYSLWTQKIGIYCLSTNEMNDLMWGHYATDSGFKIKFKSQDLIKSLNHNNENECKIFPINYVQKKFQVDTSKYGIGIPLLLDFSTKVHSWNYENEWRIVMVKNDMDVPNKIKTPSIKEHEGTDSRLFKFDISCVSEIVLGMDFFNGHNLENSRYITNKMRIVKTKDESLIRFLDFLITNLSHKIFQAGIYLDSEMPFDGAHPISRSIEKISIEKINENEFKLMRNNPESIRKF